MELSTIIPHIEALIFASDKPLSNVELTEYVNNALGFIEDRASMEQVESAVDGIREKYDSEFYAFELKQSGGGWQFLTKVEYHKTVALINGDKFIKKLSNAALETLAIIAYKQPITKSEIESIRGVNCDYAVQKLLEKDLIIISGRNENAVGKPLIYNTSKSFMDYFGINSADDLPKIREVLMEEYEKATLVEDIIEEQAAFEDGAIPTLLHDAELADYTRGEEVTVEEEVVNEELVAEETVTETLVEEETLAAIAEDDNHKEDKETDDAMDVANGVDEDEDVDLAEDIVVAEELVVSEDEAATEEMDETVDIAEAEDENAAGIDPTEEKQGEPEA